MPVTPEAIHIAGRKIGRGCPCYIIAEIGVNHHGDVSLGKKMIEAAEKAGADAVKFQAFSADRLLSRNLPKVRYLEARRKEPVEALFRRLELHEDDFRELAETAGEHALHFLASPFDAHWLDSLCAMGMPAIKIASGEITNVPLLRCMARKKLPVILSTGMSDLEEISYARRLLLEEGAPGMVVLQCTSNYPTEPENANLLALATLREELHALTGLSDHTLGTTAAVIAVALGACVIEKHFTLDCDLPGPDHHASADPGTFREMVDRVRETEMMLGDGVKQALPSEEDVKAFGRRSIVTARALTAGAVLKRGDLVCKRPGAGIAPAHLDRLLGRRLRLDLDRDVLLDWRHIE